MPGTLFVVATPIGNLEDITLRALRVLREADVIAAEDTRRTANLLAHYSIATRTLSFHKHNVRTRTPELLRRLGAGEGVALVTDAGTPGISDPGCELVQACWKNGITIDPVPGASAPMTAAVASGFPLDSLTVLGFVPVRAQDRTAWVIRAREVSGTFTFFETPHRIIRTLSEIQDYFGSRPIMVAREMTKLHQQFVHGPAPGILGHLTSKKGEFTIVVGPAAAAGDGLLPVTDEQIFLEFGQTTDSGTGGRRAVVSALAKKYGRSAKYVYGVVERLKT